MQSALTTAHAVVVVPYKPAPPNGFFPQKQRLHYRRARLAPLRSNDVAVDYESSNTSVFPAEACETIGGDACLADAFPEAKLKPEKEAKAASKEEAVDREYLEYTDPKTVLMDEACDVLGGEFCEPPYQQK